MIPLVPDRALVELRPCHPERLEPGDVALVRVSGTTYLHKVLALDLPRQRVQIGSNRSRVNGWTSFDKVAGIAVSVDGAPRPHLSGKLRPASDASSEG